MPIKCYDYFAAGLPLINSLGRNLQHLVTTKKLGYQYKAADVDSLQKAVTSLLKEDLHQMKIRCKEIGNEFNNTVQYGKYVELVKNVENRKSTLSI